MSEKKSNDHENHSNEDEDFGLPEVNITPLSEVPKNEAHGAGMAAHRDAWRRLLRRSRRQLGLFTAAHAVADGVSRWHLARQLELGTVERWGRGLYAFAGMPDGWERRALAGQLLGGPSCVMSHDTAGYLLELRGVPRPSRIELVYPRRRERRLADVTVHTTFVLPEEHVTEVGPHRVTNPARTIRDLAWRYDGPRLEHVFHEAWRRGSTDPDEVRRCHERFPPESRPRTLTSALDRADPSVTRLRSGEEGRAFRLVRDSDLPTPEVDWEVVVADGSIRFFVDLAYPDVRVAVEVDPPLYHSIGPDRARDEARRRAIGEAGWVIVPVTSEELRWRPELFLSRLRAALTAAGHPSLA
jgi:hypothetical protein